MLQRLFFQFSYYQKPPWDTGISPPELIEFIQTHTPGRAIDIGCGTGTNVMTLVHAGWQVTGVDYAPRAIRLAKQKIKAAKLRAEVSVNDATKLNGIHGPFDLALDIGCFHGLSQSGQGRYLEQLDRLLAAEGFWLMYGFFRPDTDHAPPGLLEADIGRITTRLTLLSRRDGLNRGEIPSAWFHFQK
ncbi:MAG: class I SAM-dependent methyltransferase, partial [Bacteroidota bacterium]